MKNQEFKKGIIQEFLYNEIEDYLYTDNTLEQIYVLTEEQIEELTNLLLANPLIIQDGEIDTDIYEFIFNQYIEKNISNIKIEEIN